MTAAVARQWWVLAQILPPHVQSDIFVEVLIAIWCDVTNALKKIYKNTLDELVQTKPNLFSSSTDLFVVIDKAQQAAKEPEGYFLSSDGTALHPILHEILKFWADLKFFVVWFFQELACC